MVGIIPLPSSSSSSTTIATMATPSITTTKDSNYTTSPSSSSTSDAANDNHDIQSFMKCGRALSTFCSEVRWLLPGGITIVGMYVVDEAVQIANIDHEYARHVLSATTERLLLKSTQQRSKLIVDDYSARTSVDTSSSSKPRNVTLKCQRGVTSSLHRFDTVFNLHDIILPLSSISSSSSPPSSLSLINEQIASSVGRYIESLSTNLAMIDNRTIDLEQSIDKTFSESKSTSSVSRSSKKKSSSSQSQLCHQVEFLASLDNNSNNDDEGKSSPSILVRCNGSLVCTSYVHPRQTCQYAVQCLKHDAINSIPHRLKIISGAMSHSTTGLSYASIMPSRVTLQWQPYLRLCSYDRDLPRITSILGDSISDDKIIPRETQPPSSLLSELHIPASAAPPRSVSTLQPTQLSTSSTNETSSQSSVGSSSVAPTIPIHSASPQSQSPSRLQQSALTSTKLPSGSTSSSSLTIAFIVVLIAITVAFSRLL